MKSLFAALALAAAACGQGDAVKDSPPKPQVQAAKLELTGRVIDRAELIDAPTETALTSRLAALEADTTDQLVIVTIPSLEGEKIEKAAMDLGNRWGIGRADVDNGVMLMVAPSDRQVRIAVGLGLEGLLTDEKAGEIIDRMLPEFRAGRVQQAILQGVDGIETILKSEKRRPQPRPGAMKEAA